MRIQSSKVLDAQMRAIGAIPQVMALSEVYQGLQTGVIDEVVMHERLLDHRQMKLVDLAEAGHRGLGDFRDRGLPVENPYSP